MRGLRGSPPGTSLLRLIARLVPWWRRREWLAEWEAELAWAAGERSGLALRWRTLGALGDALWLRRRHGRQGVLFQDAIHAARSLRKRPGFTVAVILTLALGIGGSTAVFSIADAVLLRPEPYAEVDRLVRLWRELPGGYGVPGLNAAALEAWAGQRALFEAVEGHETESAVLTGAGDPVVVTLATFTSGLIEMLGVPPMRGRSFTAEEARRGERVVLVGEDFWRSGLGGRGGVVGSTVRLNDEPYTVIGVMPRRFRFPNGGIEFYAPMGPDGYRAGVARLASGVTLDGARSLEARLSEAYAAEGATTWNLIIAPFAGSDRLAGRGGTALVLLGGAVLALLLIGCTNAVNLLLVHAADRDRELAVRSALGASRGHIVRLILLECGFLAGLAAALGIGLAWIGTRALGVGTPPSYAIFAPGDIRVDVRVLAFAGALALACALAFGVGPALVASRSNRPLTGTNRTVTGGRRVRRLRDGLAVLELALAMMLLTSAAVLMRSLMNALNADRGFRTADVLVLELWPPPHRYQDAATTQAFLRAVQERLAALPGVAATSLATEAPPVAGFSFGLRIEPEGLPVPDGQPEMMPILSVDEAYFDALEIRLVEGRTFTTADVASAVPVAILDERMARWLWPDGSAVGRRFRMDEEDPWLTVVGVTADARMFGLAQTRGASVCVNDSCEFEVYRPIRQSPQRGQHAIVMRTTGEPTNLALAVREAVHTVDPGIPLQHSIMTMEQRFLDDLQEQRFVLWLLAVFTVLAAALAGVGVYGVLSHGVARRTREFGVRIALGARPADLHRAVLRRGIVFAAVGIASGLAGAASISRLLRALVFDVSALDPLALAGAAALLATVAFLATWAPARRATRVSPLAALRDE